MKRKIIAILLVLTMAVCAFPMSAFAASESAVTYSAKVNYGWFGANEYFFNILGTIYRIPHGTVCSQTYNNTVYNYVYPVQYILSDFADYYSNNGYNPYGIDGIFGGNTRNAVMYYQGRKGLQTDGDVGDQTWTSFVNQWVFG